MRLADADVAPVIHDLSHASDAQGQRRFVTTATCRCSSSARSTSAFWNASRSGAATARSRSVPNPYARKDSGSFYTPQELVDLIVERTLKPLAEERLKAFEEKAEALKSDRRPKAQRQAELLKLDPAEAVLDLKVLDPAMGSGHFLVTCGRLPVRLRGRADRVRPRGPRSGSTANTPRRW